MNQSLPNIISENVDWNDVTQVDFIRKLLVRDTKLGHFHFKIDNRPCSDIEINQHVDREIDRLKHEHDNYSSHIIKADKDMAGFFVTKNNLRNAGNLNIELYMISILEAHKNQGIGMFILDSIEKQVQKQAGHHRVTLKARCRESSDVMKNILKKQDFIKCTKHKSTNNELYTKEIRNH